MATISKEVELRQNSRLQIIERILANLKGKLTQTEYNIIYDILVKDASFQSLVPKHKVSMNSMKEILSIAVRKTNQIIDNTFDDASAYQKIKSEVLDLENKATKPLRKIDTLSEKTRLILTTKIEELKFSTRVRTICKREGVLHILDIVNLSPIEFLAFQNCGKNCIVELEAFLKANDLWWGMLKED